MITYGELSAEERYAAGKQFLQLQAIAEEYNRSAKEINGELEAATELAFAPIASGAFLFLAALLALLKKKFLI